MVPEGSWYHSELGTKESLVPQQAWYQKDPGTTENLVPQRPGEILLLEES